MSHKTLFLTLIAFLYCLSASAQNQYHFFEPEQMRGKVIAVTRLESGNMPVSRHIMYNDTIFYDSMPVANEYFRWINAWKRREFFKTNLTVTALDSGLRIEQTEAVHRIHKITWLNKYGLPDSVITVVASGKKFKSLSSWDESKRELILTQYADGKPAQRDTYIFNKRHLIEEVRKEGPFRATFKYAYKDFDKYGNWTWCITERSQQVGAGPSVTTEITERQIIYAN